MLLSSIYCSAVPQAQHSIVAVQVCADPSATTQASRQEVIYFFAVPPSQHSTAQSARTKPQSKYVPIRARQRKQVDRIGESQQNMS